MIFENKIFFRFKIYEIYLVIYKSKLTYIYNKYYKSNNEAPSFTII